MPLGRGVLGGKPRTAAGLRNKAVLIEQAVDATADSGFPTETWTPLRTVKMSKTDLRADERFATAQESSFKEIQWHAPYSEDWDPDVIDVPKLRRLNYLGRIHDIQSASIIGNRLGVEFITLGD